MAFFEKRKQFIHLFAIAVFLILVVTACDKTDHPIEDEPDAETVKDIDGNKYNTIKIGSQVWTVENLKTTRYNDGTEITNVTSGSQWGNLTTGAYCNYDNLESNAVTYGRLYNWHAVNTGKLAPAGWHVPTNEEWVTLESYLLNNGYNYDGSSSFYYFGKALAADTGWQFSNKVGSVGNTDYPEYRNKSGFSALPGGKRSPDGTFSEIGYSGYWWTNTTNGSNFALYRNIWFGEIGFGRASNFKKMGQSVRCIKD